MQSLIESMRNSMRGDSCRKIFNIRISLIILLFLVLLITSVFSGVFSHSFVGYDDYRMIVNRVDAYDGFSTDTLKGIFYKDFPREEPLIVRDLSYLVNTSIFGPLNPRGYLLGNLLLHIGVCYLVYLLSLQFFPKEYLLASFAAILFSIHPMHVESIAWISSRKDPLYVIFFLSAFLSYIRYFRFQNKQQLCWSVFLFCCALFSKSAAISFLPVLLVYRVVLRRFVPLTRKEAIFLTGILLLTLFFIIWYTSVLTEFGILNQKKFFDRNWSLWIISNFEYITFYLQKLLYPTELSILYEFPAPQFIYDHLPYLIISLVTVGCGFLIVIIALHRKINELAFLGLFFLCALLPYLDLAQVNIFVANRYVYLASVAFCITLSWTAIMIGNYVHEKKYNSKLICCICCIIYCFFLGRETLKAIRPWENTIQLWRNAYRIAPNMPDVYSGLMQEYMLMYFDNIQDKNAMIFLNEGKKIGEIALSRFCKNYDRCPSQLDKILYSLGQMFWLEGRIDMAENYFKNSLKLNPVFHDARLLYIKFLSEQNRFEEAMHNVRIIEQTANPYRDKHIFADIENSILPMIHDKNRHK